MSATRSRRPARRAAARRNNEFVGDMAAWEQDNGPDNGSEMARLRQNMRKVRSAELTPRQDEMVHLYYDIGLSIPRIAQQLGVHKSTVSRTLARARVTLKRYLQSSF